MQKLYIGVLVVFTLSGTRASAADPVTAGTTNVGTVPGYGTAYSGFWRTGTDYALLTDGVNTFVNAPNANGGIFFRFHNSDALTLSSSNFMVNTTANFSQLAYFNRGLQSSAPGGSWASYSLGSDLGVAAIGSTYALYAQGPIYGSTTLTLSGQAYKPGGGSFAAPSDVRVKKDVSDFSSGLSEIEQVHTVRFKYNGLGETEDTGKEYVGVIAQELERVAPFMVTEAEKKLHKSDAVATAIKQVDPSAFTYMLVNAVQELSRQNKEMRKLICRDHPTDSFCTGVQR